MPAASFHISNGLGFLIKLPAASLNPFLIALSKALSNLYASAKKL